MTLPQNIDDLLSRIDELGYDLVDRRDYDGRTVVRFKRPNGLNIGAATVFPDDVLLGDYSPRVYYTPITVFDPAAGTGATLTTIANPPYGTPELLS